MKNKVKIVRVGGYDPKKAELVKAAERMDWGQVVLNGGPPCFQILDGHFCGRAEKWAGHGTADHPFVSLKDLLSSLTREGDL